MQLPNRTDPRDTTPTDLFHLVPHNIETLEHRGQGFMCTIGRTMFGINSINSGLSSALQTPPKWIGVLVGTAFAPLMLSCHGPN